MMLYNVERLNILTREKKMQFYLSVFVFYKALPTGRYLCQQIPSTCVMHYSV